jgi:uracil-DNA glycosylase
MTHDVTQSSELRDRQAQLDQIAAEVARLEESPLYEYRVREGYKPVIGTGDPGARILFVGEAPGKQEAKSGRPFVGAAGRILDDLFASIGLARDQVYITNIVKDRPPDNRDPRAAEIALYAPFLARQIEIIRPRVIVPLGRFALAFMLEHFGLDAAEATIGTMHGRPIDVDAPYGLVTLIPLYHPASVFYVTERRDVLERDFQVLKRYLA